MMRAHLISLSLLLGLTVSLVWGQAPTRFTLSGVTVTGPIAIASVGNDYNASPSLICHTTNATNTVWLFPDGSMITEATTNVIALDTFIFYRSLATNNNIVYLRRGFSVRLPGGDYCCGSATNVNERLCINLVVDCEMPPSISNGCLGMLTSTLLGGTVTYTCNSGYQISPGITMATASCLATGNWETVTCLAVDCGTPPSISNGSPGIPTSISFEGTVTYTCNNGYQISSGVTMATASCLATGNWENVTCLAMCPDLQPLMNGAITYQPAGTLQLEGTNATHSCTSGYRLSGGPVRVCQSDRTWSGDNITCLAETIGTPPHALSQSETTIAILSAVVVILGLALILLAVINAYLVLKLRRMGGVNLKTPDIPLTDKGQSSPTQTYDTMDVSYEEIDVPRPQKGSYEYTQCEAYAPTPGGGVVNVVKTH